MVGELRNGKGFLRPGDNRDIKVTAFEVNKVDILKIKPMYEYLHEELVIDGWVDPDDGGGNFETLYYERILANGMKEHHIWWRMIRAPNAPMRNDFLRWALKIDFQTLAVTPTEVPYKGGKATVDKCDLAIRCWFYIQWDPLDKFRNSFVGSMENTFRRKLYKKDLEQQWLDLFNEAQKIKALMKNFMEMEEDGEQPQLFHQVRGYKDHISP